MAVALAGANAQAVKPEQNMHVATGKAVSSFMAMRNTEEKLHDTEEKLHDTEEKLHDTEEKLFGTEKKLQAALQEVAELKSAKQEGTTSALHQELALRPRLQDEHRVSKSKQKTKTKRPAL